MPAVTQPAFRVISAPLDGNHNGNFDIRVSKWLTKFGYKLRGEAQFFVINNQLYGVQTLVK
jgi:hypothetical protein